KIETNKDSKNSCKIPDVLVKDNIDYSEDGYIGGFSWTRPVLSINRPIGFNSTFKREGADHVPEKVKGYAVSSDFSHFYTFKEKPQKQRNYFGKYFEQYIKQPGNYFFVLEFEIDGKSQQFSTRTSVVP